MNNGKKTAYMQCTHFSTEEIYIAKKYISDHFTLSQNKEEGFIIFCERVLLARKYILADKNRFIPLPSVWLNKYNTKGFAGTKKWHDDTSETRHSLPSYKSEIRSLAKAIFEYGQQPSPENYHYRRDHFTSNREHDLLILFQLFVINYHRPKATLHPSMPPKGRKMENKI